MARRRRNEALTPREEEVLELIRDGLSNEQIAARLGISIDGVKFHVSEILGRLGVHDRLEAARWRPDADRQRSLALLAFLLRGQRYFAPLGMAITAIAIAAAVGLLVWGLLATEHRGAATVDPDQTVRDYFKALATSDVGLFCDRIVPALGWFADDKECRDLSRASVAQGGRFAPGAFVDNQPYDNVHAEITEIRDADVGTNDAILLVALTWKGRDPHGAEQDLGAMKYDIDLVKTDEHWQIGNVRGALQNQPVAVPTDLGIAVQKLYAAYTMRGPEYSDAVCEVTALQASGLANAENCRHHVGFPLATRSDVHEGKSQPVLTQIVSVDLKRDLAYVTVTASLIANGALGPPSSWRHLFALEDGRWGQVYGLSEDEKQRLFDAAPQD